MKWRKISENEVKSAINEPDSLADTIKGRKNALKIVGGRSLKVTLQAGRKNANCDNGAGQRRITYEDRI